MTRLESFIRLNGIRPLPLARESGYSRQHLLRLRMGQMEPTRPCIAALVTACQRLLGRAVRAADLFELGEAMDARSGPAIAGTQSVN